MLRHFSRASNLFSRLSFADISELRDKHSKRPDTHTLRGPVNAKEVCGLWIFLPYHIASVFVLFNSKPEHTLKLKHLISRRVLQLNLCRARNRCRRLKTGGVAALDVVAKTPNPLY